MDEGYFSRRATGAFGAMDSDHFLAYFDRFREEFDPAFVQWVDENILAR